MNRERDARPEADSGLKERKARLRVEVYLAPVYGDPINDDRKLSIRGAAKAMKMSVNTLCKYGLENLLYAAESYRSEKRAQVRIILTNAGMPNVLGSVEGRWDGIELEGRTFHQVGSCVFATPTNVETTHPIEMIKNGEKLVIDGGARCSGSSTNLRTLLEKRLKHVDGIRILGWRLHLNLCDPHKTWSSAVVFADAWYKETGEAIFHSIKARYSECGNHAVCSVRRRTLEEMLVYQRNVHSDAQDRGEFFEPDSDDVLTQLLELDSLRQTNLSGWFRGLSDKEQLLLFSRGLTFHGDLLTKLKPLDLTRVLADGDSMVREKAIRLFGHLG